RIYRHVEADGDAPLRVGDSDPLEETYCQRIVDGRLPELIPDTAALPAAAALPITVSGRIGAHLSIPIRLRDGRVYGTFCCFNFAADRSLNERDRSTMRAFAELTANQIETDLETMQERDEKL